MHQKGNEYIYSIYQSVSEECKLKEDWEKTWLYIRSVKYICYGRLCPARREFPVQAKLQIRWWMFNVRKNVIRVGFSANYVSFLLQNLIFILYRSITNKYLSLSCIYTIHIVCFCSHFYSIVLFIETKLNHLCIDSYLFHAGASPNVTHLKYILKELIIIIRTLRSGSAALKTQPVGGRRKREHGA